MFFLSLFLFYLSHLPYLSVSLRVMEWLPVFVYRTAFMGGEVNNSDGLKSSKHSVKNQPLTFLPDGTV